MKLMIKFAFASCFLFMGATRINAQIIPPTEVSGLLTKYTCVACHKVGDKLVGPSWMEVAKKKYKPEKIVALVHKPEPANWPGYTPMAALPQVPKADIVKIAKWIKTLEPK